MSKRSPVQEDNFQFAKGLIESNFAPLPMNLLFRLTLEDMIELNIDQNTIDHTIKIQKANNQLQIDEAIWQKQNKLKNHNCDNSKESKTPHADLLKEISTKINSVSITIESIGEISFNETGDTGFITLEVSLPFKNDIQKKLYNEQMAQFGIVEN